MPYFEVKDQDGNIVNSEELIGRKTIIYFYPKDNTSGCTAEACNLRDNYEALVAKGYNVIGVSKDSIKSHKNFKEKTFKIRLCKYSLSPLECRRTFNGCFYLH